MNTDSETKDRDIPERLWRGYLKKKYGKKYRIFFDKLGISSIRCKYGFVQPYSILKKELVAALTYKTSRGINILLKNLQSQKALEFRINQRGDFEVCIVFDEKYMNKMAELLSFGHRRQISEKQRKILAERLEKARAVKNGV